MKKAILGLAFLTVAAMAMPAAAKKQDNKECKAQTECTSKDKKCCKEAKNCPFADLNLTSEQQGRIEALNQGLKISKKEIKEQAKTARQNRDTTFNARKANKELRMKYINDLGEILTSDQMVVFLKNYYVNNPAQKMQKGAKAMKQGKGPKQGKGMKPGMKGQGQKGQKGQRPARQQAEATK